MYIKQCYLYWLKLNGLGWLTIMYLLYIWLQTVRDSSKKIAFVILLIEAE